MNKYRVGFIVILMLSMKVMAGPLVYIPTGNTNEIIIVDLATDKIIGRIDELENDHGLSSSPNSDYLVAGSMKPLESKGQLGPDKPAAVSEAEHEAHHAGGNGDSVVANSQSYLSIVDPKHGRVMQRVAVRSLTHHTVVSPDGKRAIAVHSGVGGISVIDLDKMVVLKLIDTGLRPNFAVFSKDGQRLYVSNSGANTISEIDTQSWKVSREFSVGKEPEHLVLGTHERILYTANKGDASVSAIDLASGKVKQSYTVGDKPHGIDVSDDGRWLFVASKKDGLITRINLSSGETKTAELNPAPYHLAYIKQQSKLYVSSRKEPIIWVIDPMTLGVKNTIDLGKGVAHQMVVRDE